MFCTAAKRVNQLNDAEHVMVCAYFDEGSFVGRRVFETLVAVTANKLSDDAPRVTSRFQRRKHVERHWQRATVRDVHEPETCARKFPLHVTVALQHSIICMDHTHSCTHAHTKYTAVYHTL